MRIIDVEQGSEAWQALRARPTASNFDRIITPVKGDYAERPARAYACEIVAKRLGVYTEPPPSYWMQWGVDNEPNAKHAYMLATGSEITPCGFALPDGTDAYGGSPDGLIGDDGMLEIKCPKPETIIQWHAEGGLPVAYRPQVQGLLLITGRQWCDFVGFHPGLSLYVYRVVPDISYQTKLAECLLLLLEELRRIEGLVRRQDHELVCVSTASMGYSMRGLSDE